MPDFRSATAAVLLSACSFFTHPPRSRTPIIVDTSVAVAFAAAAIASGIAASRVQATPGLLMPLADIDESIDAGGAIIFGAWSAVFATSAIYGAANNEPRD